MIKKGDVVKIKPDWQDPGDDLYVWVALDDEEKGRVTIAPCIVSLPIPPVQTVMAEWLE